EHPVEDAAMDGLQAVARVGQGPRHDHGHGVVEERPLHFLLELDGLDRPEFERRLVAHQISRKRTSLAFVELKCLRSSTSSPMSTEKTLSASAASSTATFRSVRCSGSMVVTLSSSKSISPRPFRRWNSGSLPVFSA